MKIFVISVVNGPIAYFKQFGNALAYWSYIQDGDGLNPSVCNLIGVHRDEVTMSEITLFDVDNEEAMELVYSVNTERRTRNRMEQFLELRTSPEEIYPRSDQAQGGIVQLLDQAPPCRTSILQNGPGPIV